MLAGHEIGQHVRVRIFEEAEAVPQQRSCFIRQFRLVNETAPSDIARIVGAHLRHQAAPHEGATAISGNQQTACHLAAIGKTGFDPLDALLDPAAPTAPVREHRHRRFLAFAKG